MNHKKVFPPPPAHRAKIARALWIWLTEKNYSGQVKEEALAALNEEYMRLPKFSRIGKLQLPKREECLPNGDWPNWHWRHRFYRTLANILGWKERREYGDVQGEGIPKEIRNMLKFEVWPGERYGAAVKEEPVVLLEVKTEPTTENQNLATNEVAKSPGYGLEETVQAMLDIWMPNPVKPNPGPLNVAGTLAAEKEKGKDILETPEPVPEPKLKRKRSDPGSPDYHRSAIRLRPGQEQHGGNASEEGGSSHVARGRKTKRQLPPWMGERHSVNTGKSHKSA